ncbi:hypothetical protein MNB_SV-6-1344 [hydrothermal vent metagenome]|uniref:PA14 domain-containing protein n=1 Tax=hydrothermal vent metagenome TaxID=652676 RepID=A0A1W1BEX1_9ZZZZ
MKKLIVLLIPFVLIGRGYNPDDICKDVKIVAKEAEMIDKKFKDPKNAFALLNATAFRQITYRKPKCMNEKEYLSYLDTYAYLSTYSERIGTIEQFVKKYPNHIYFYKVAGESYERQFDKYQNSEYRQKALKYYAKYVELSKEKNQKVDKRVVEYLKTGGLKKAKSTWGKYLNPKGDIPIGKYRAFYIDTHNPKTVVATEIVEDIAVNYPYKEFHGIDSANFGGYWVGKLKFSKDTQKSIYVSQSNSTTRVIIDGYVVYDKKQRGGVDYNFTKGTHTIEVEFINRWHTTTLSVKVMDRVTRLKKDEIIDRLSRHVTDDTIFDYVGVYESDNKNNTIELKLEKSDKPTVLLLQSHRAVTWDIDNSNGVDIAAIVINSSRLESEVRGDIDGVEVLYSQRRVGNGYRSGLPANNKRDCQCISGHYTCGESRLFIADEIPSRFGKKVSGFSGEYAATTMSVPQVNMTPDIYKKIEQYNTKIKEMKSECTKNKSITPDKLFE